MSETNGLGYGEIYDITLKREESSHKVKLGRSLIAGATFLSKGRGVRYTLLTRPIEKNTVRSTPNILCYNFSDYVHDERGLFVRNASMKKLSDLERNLADKTLTKHGL